VGSSPTLAQVKEEKGDTHYWRMDDQIGIDMANMAEYDLAQAVREHPRPSPPLLPPVFAGGIP
jgi:hypothetical protein